MGGFALTYEIVKARLAERGCQLLVTSDEYYDLKKQHPNINGYKFPVKRDCCGKSANVSVREAGHYDGVLCIECIYKSRRLTYDNIRKKFEEHSCELVTGEEEFERERVRLGWNSYAPKLTFRTGCCGGMRESTYYDMKRVEGDWSCKVCISRNVSRSQKINSRDSDGNISAQMVEYESYQYLVELIEDLFIVQKAGASTRADCVIKPFTVEEDKWLPIQLKSTSKIRSGGSNSSYKS